MVCIGPSGRAVESSVANGLPDRRLAPPAFFALIMVLSWLSGLPIAYFGGHQVERRFGLTKQSTGGWPGDQAKGLLLGVLLETPLLTAAYAVIRRRPRDWWLIIAGASVPLLAARTRWVLRSGSGSRLPPPSPTSRPARGKGTVDSTGRIEHIGGTELRQIAATSRHTVPPGFNRYLISTMSIRRGP